MDGNKTALALCLAGYWIPSAFGFSSDGSSLSRGLDRTIALTSSAIVVTVTITNSGDAALRGFYYADQVPSGFEVSTVNVMLNGQSVTNYIFESGFDGDVYASRTPYRWVLEQPADFVETNPIAPQASAQIVYAISSSTPGTFDLGQFSWTAYDPGSTNASFGHSEDADLQGVSFVLATNAVVLVGFTSTNGYELRLEGWPGNPCVIEASTNLRSTNLFDWVPLVTNASPFSFTNTNAREFRQRFFRARLLPY